MQCTIVGLGNPGNIYQDTRHNIGFVVLDRFADEIGASFVYDRYMDAQKAVVGEFILLKPETFMNDSGKALRHTKDTPVVVVYDDIQIALGEVKCSFGRGAGGHNGVQSIIDHLGTKDFFRIRVGVRPVSEELLSRIAPPDGFEKFLLSDFAPFEQELREQGIKKAVAIIEALKTKTFEEIMNAFN